MRSPRWLLASVLFVPSLASAQVFVPPPPPMPPPPPHVYIQQRIHWHLRRTPPAVVVTPPAPPVWVAPAAPPPPVYYSPAPPLVHIEPQQPVRVYPQPVYQQPHCCVQPPPVMVRPPAPVAVAPVVVSQPVVARPEWSSRFGLGASVEGTFGHDDNASRGYGVLGQLRYRTSRHTALELMAGYERANYQSGIERQDVPVTFGLLIPFLGPEHVFSPYLVGALGLNFARLRLVDSPDFRLDDSRLQGVAQLGGGFELRLGQHLSLNTDARLEGRWNASDPSDEVSGAVVKVDGQVVDPLKNSVGVRLGVGATIYF